MEKAADGLDSAALRRAVRAPLRRWWLRVGVWLVLAWALVVFLLWLNHELLMKWGMLQQPWAFQLTYFTYRGMGALHLLNELALPGLWLWAGAIAAGSLRSLFSHVAAPRLAIPPGAQFVIAWQAGWPLALVGVLAAVYCAMARRVLEGGPFNFGPPVAGTSSFHTGEGWTIQHFLANSLGAIAGDIALALVLVALYVLTGRMRYSLMLLALVKLNAVAFLFSRTLELQGSYNFLLGASTLEYASWIGLLFAVMMLAGFVLRRGSVAWGGYGLLAAGGAFQAFRGTGLPVPEVALPVWLLPPFKLLESATMRFFGGQAFLMTLRDEAQVLTGAHRLLVYPLNATWVIADAWLALAAAVLVNLLWLVLLWLIIRWGMMRLAIGAPSR